MAGMRQRWARWAVNVCRAVLAATFVFSGFTKAVDPIGTQYKIRDYLAAWQMAGIVPDALTLAASVAMSAAEFTLGVCLLFAMHRRATSRLLLLVMALTGLTWSFGWYRTGFYALFGVEAQSSGMGHGNAAAHARQKGGKDRGGQQPELRTACWQEVCDRLRQENPDAEQITIADGTASIPANRFGNTRASDRYTFDPRTGELARGARARELGVDDRHAHGNEVRRLVMVGHDNVHAALNEPRDLVRSRDAVIYGDQEIGVA